MTKKWIAALGVSAALAFAAPQSAEAQPVVTGGLVNVTIVDAVDANNNQILNNLTVAAAVQIAANVCGIAVNVLTQDLAQDGRAVCTTGDQTVTMIQRRGRR